MELCVNQRQLSILIKNSVNQQLKIYEQDATSAPSAGTDPEAAKPSAGTGDTGSKAGYPEVTKWESGVQRGADNQIAVTKWSDIVGSKISRGKSNPLTEQSGISTYFAGKTPGGSNIPGLKGDEISNVYKSIDTHDILSVLELGSLFIPYIGPFISAGIGLGNAGLYWKEGDKKTAGLFALFSVLPFVGEIPAVKKLGKSGMDILAKKLSLQGSKVTLTPIEKEVLNGVKSNKGVIKQKINNVVKKKSIDALKSGKSLQTKTQKFLLGASKFGLETSMFLGAGAAYNFGYDKLNSSNQFSIPIGTELEQEVINLGQSIPENEFERFIQPIILKYLSNNQDKNNRIKLNVLKAYTKNKNSNLDIVAKQTI